MYKEKIVNLETNEETFRDYTPEEIAEIEAEILKNEIKAAENLQKLKEKNALYARLGLTPDEAKLILG